MNVFLLRLDSQRQTRGNLCLCSGSEYDGDAYGGGYSGKI